MSEALTERLAAGSAVGRYRILGHLADGEAGAIYLAEMPGATKRRMVLRVIHAERRADPDLVQTFVDETRRALRLHHPNVVQTLDLVRTDSHLAAALEYTPGLPVVALYPKGSIHVEVGPAMVAWIGAEAAAGLHHAHTLADSGGKGLGIVHGDVCPMNVRVGFDGRVRIADFGMARALARLGKVASPHGLHAYAAPEQVSGGTIDARADVWGLGVILWELLARYRLFRRITEEETAKAVLEDEIPPLDEVREDVSAELESAIVRSLERDVAKRWQTAKELEEALRATLPRNVEPVREPLVAALAAPRDAYIERFGEVLGKDLRSIPTLGLVPARSVPVAKAASGDPVRKPYLRPASSPGMEAASPQAATPKAAPKPLAITIEKRKPAPAPAVAPAAARAAIAPEAPTAPRPPPLPPPEASAVGKPPPPPAAAAAVDVPRASEVGIEMETAPPSLPPRAAQPAAIVPPPLPKRAPEEAIDVDMESMAPPAPSEQKPKKAPIPAFVQPPAAFVAETPSVLDVAPMMPAPAYPDAPAQPSANAVASAADAKRKRLLLVGGGIAVLLVLVLAVSLSSGGEPEVEEDSDTPATSEPQEVASAPHGKTPPRPGTTAPASSAPETAAPATAAPNAELVDVRIEANRPEAWVEVDGGARRDLPLDLTGVRRGAVLALRAGAECCRERQTTVTAGAEPVVRLWLPTRDDDGHTETKRTKTKRGGEGLAKNPFGD